MRSQHMLRLIGLAIVILLQLTVLAPGSLVQASSRRQVPGPIDIGVTVRGVAHQTPEGQATIRGSVTCTEPTEVNLILRVNQEQADNGLVRGLERVTVTCTVGAPVPFTVTVTPVGLGSFVKGFAEVVVVRALGCGEIDCDVDILAKRIWIRHHTEPIVEP